MDDMDCKHCTAPETNCPYWSGTFCSLDVNKEE